MRLEHAGMAAFAFVWIAALGAGCGNGDDDDNGGGGSGTDIGGSLGGSNVSEMSDDELTKMCEDKIAELQKELPPSQICTYIAVESTAGAPALCQRLSTTCVPLLEDVLASFCTPAQEPTDAGTDEGGTGGEEPECDATTAEVDQCFDDMLAAYKAAMSGVKCGDKPSGKDLDALEPESCKALEEKCPDMVYTVDDSGVS